MPCTVPNTKNTTVALPALPIHPHGSEARRSQTHVQHALQNAKIPEACLHLTEEET